MRTAASDQKTEINMYRYIRNRINQNWEFYKLVVKNNSGVSSKNYALVAGVTIAKWWALVYLPAIILIDQLFGLSPAINLWGVATLIGAIEAILAILILGKVKSEQYEHKHNYHENHTEPETHQ